MSFCVVLCVSLSTVLGELLYSIEWLNLESVVSALQTCSYNQDNHYFYAVDGEENWYSNCLKLPINYGSPAEVIHEG